MKVKHICVLILFSFLVISIVAFVQADLPPDFIIPPTHLIEQVVSPYIPKPLAIAINSSGELFFTGHDGYSVYQLHDDGSVTTSDKYTIGVYHTAMDFDAEDNLYVVVDGQLWRIAPDGTAELVAPEINAYQLSVGPAGDIFTVGASSTEVMHITPQGTVSVYASGLTAASDVDVNPITGEVYVADWGTGSIARANPDGSITVVSSGPASGGHYIAFSATGQLFLAIEGRLASVSIADGSRTIQDWISGVYSNNCGLTIKLIEFDHNGQLITADYTTGDIGRLDLDEERFEVLVQGIVNPPALTVAPNGGGIYLGLPSLHCSGNGRILRIDEDGQPILVNQKMPPSVNYITFDRDGLGYASSGGKVYTFTSNGSVNLWIEEQIGVQKLAVHPLTKVLWGAGAEGIWYADENRQVKNIPYPFEQTHHEPTLAFTPDGKLYVFVCRDEGPYPGQPAIYRFDPGDNSFDLLLNLPRRPSGCSVESMTGSIDGNLYWILEDLLRITPAGEATVFASIPGGDPLSLVAGPDNTDLTFGNAAGIFRIFEAKAVFLPITIGR